MENVDHNIRTLDGKDAFHEMGIIDNITPKTGRTLVIPWVTVSAEDVAQIGCINIRYFKSACSGMQ